MREVIHLLGASLVWIVVLFGIDKYLSDNAILILDSYPAEIPIWGIGALSWSYYLLQRLGKSSKALQLPKLLMIQTSMAVGITTTFGLMVNDETMTTVSNVWIWGTVIAIGLLFASSLIASAWSSTKKLVDSKTTNINRLLNLDFLLSPSQYSFDGIQQYLHQFPITLNLSTSAQRDILQHNRNRLKLELQNLQFPLQTVAANNFTPSESRR